MSASTFAAHLAPGEKVLWSGEPPHGFLLRAEDAFLAPFSFAFLGFASHFVWATREGPPAFVIAGSLLFLASLYAALGRFIVDARLRRHTRYAITNRRILVVGGWRGRNCVAFDYPDAWIISVVPGVGRRKTVRFEPSWPFLKWHATYWRNGEFFAVLDADLAKALLTKNPNA